MKEKKLPVEVGRSKNGNDCGEIAKEMVKNE
jgi:hypothetical protein